MNKLQAYYSVMVVLFNVIPILGAQTEAQVQTLLIDDFSTAISNFGTPWEGLTDQVMGGKSDMNIGYKREEGRQFLSFSGQVRLENFGGFIQARLGLSKDSNKRFDASSYSGIRLSVRGNGQDYYLFLRTSGNRLPWSFFMAPLPLSAEWTEIDVPFSSFKKGDFGSFFKLDTRKLTSLALVAYKKEFRAELDVREIMFY